MTGPWIAAFIMLWILTVVVAVVVTGILRRSTATLDRLDEYLKLEERANHTTRLPIGSEVPPFEAEDLAGQTVRSETLFEKPVVVLFLGEACAPCDVLLDQIMTSPPDLGDHRLVVVGKREIVAGLAERFDRDTLHVFVEGAAGAVARAFDSRITPQSFRVEPPGRLAAVDIPNTVRELESLVAHTEGGESTVVR